MDLFMPVMPLNYGEEQMPLEEEQGTGIPRSSSQPLGEGKSSSTQGTWALGPGTQRRGLPGGGQAPEPGAVRPGVCGPRRPWKEICLGVCYP